MTKFRVYRVSTQGQVRVEVVEAFDWTSLLSSQQYNGDPMFKIEVVGATEQFGSDQPNNVYHN